MLRILKRDFKRLFKTPAAIIVAIALLVLPSLYTWYNVVAFWNPYEETGNLQVCVVNQDKGTTTDATGQLNVGDKIAEELLANDQLRWMTEGYDEAMHDLEIGNVYAVYVIPEDFSTCLVSPLTGTVTSPHIEYFTNEKLGPVSPKITDAAATALDQKINSMFVGTVTEVAVEAVDKAAGKASAAIDAAEARISSKAGSADDVVSEVRRALSGSQGIIGDARAKLAEAGSAIAEAAAISADGKRILQDVADEAEALRASLSSMSSETLPLLSDVLARLSQFTAKASTAANDLTAAAAEAKAKVDIAIARIQPVVDTMREVSRILQAASDALPGDGPIKAELAERAREMSERADRLQAILDDAAELAARVDTVAQNAASTVGSLNELAKRASDSFQGFANNLYDSAAGAVNAVVAEISDACGRLSGAVTGLEAAVEDAQPVIGQLDGILADCGKALEQTDALVGGIQEDLETVVTDARMLANSDTIAGLVENGTLNAQGISSFMSAPTELSTVRFYHPNSYGAAMAPLFMNLTFWIGAFMLVIIFRLEVDSEGLEDPKPWQRYLGRFIMFCIFALLQSAICCAGTLALGVQAANVVALFFASAAASLAYTSIIYALSATFRHLGKALCIVLVFAQIPGGSGLYPLELTSSFFQSIYPFLPFSYGIGAIRESIGGFYGSYFAHDLSILGLFFAVALAAGLILGPLMSNVVRMTTRQIREGDFYNGEDVLTPERPYRLTHLLRALSEKESYRQELEERYARFSRHYPLFIRASIIVGVGVPVALVLLFALDAGEKAVLLTIFLLWLVALMGFLIIVESRRYSFERQLQIEGMSEASLLNLFANRDRLVGPGRRLSARRAAAAADEAPEPPDDGGPDDGAEQAGDDAPSGPGNIRMIVAHDMSALFRNIMSAIMTVGLIVLPSIFAWYNILACWNVFDNTGNLSVAVASEDEGFTSDLVPINVNIGDKVVSALRGNDQINWVFTDPEDAVEGTKAGTYYAAIVIPEDFSKDMLTFYSGDAPSASIDYYVNEKKNAIAPNITGVGADTVSYEVNATFADTISEIAVGLGQVLVKVGEDGDVSSHVANLAQHMRSLASRLDQSADVLGLYSSIGADSQGLMEGGAVVVRSTRARIQDVAAQIDADKQRLREMVERLAGSVSVLDSALEEARSAVAELDGMTDKLLANMTTDVAAVSAGLREKAAEIDGKNAEVAAVLARLKELREELKSGIERELGGTSLEGHALPELDAEVKVMIEDTLLLDECIAALEKVSDVLQRASAACSESADALDAGSAGAQQAVNDLRQIAAAAQADIEAARSKLAEDLGPTTEKLKADVAALAAELERGVGRLEALGPDLADTLDTVAAALSGVSAKADGGAAELRSAAQGVRDLAAAVDEVLVSGDTTMLRSLLQGNAGVLASALTAPVQIERTALYPCENFGSAMAPLYCTLAIFIGSLLIMVSTRIEVSERIRRRLANPKPRHLYFGRFGTIAAISLAQTTLLGLGNMFFLKVQVAEPLLFMLAFWISGLVFAFIIYTLVVAFGNLGKAIAVLLLIVQVTACNGSYPLQILPDFVQAISPWVPATYVVEALRAAMMGVYQADFWMAIGHLALFVIPFLLLGLVLRKPLVRVMKGYVERVGRCKIME